MDSRGGPRRRHGHAAIVGLVSTGAGRRGGPRATATAVGRPRGVARGRPPASVAAGPGGAVGVARPRLGPRPAAPARWRHRRAARPRSTWRRSKPSLEAGRPALVLVPEIALALPLVDRLRADVDAGSRWSTAGLGEGERADEWRRIRAGDVDIVVGTRLAVLAPLADIGLVIVDEEHDPAYKSDRTPRLQARDVGGRAGPSWPARRSSWARPRPPSTASAGRAPATTTGSCCRPGRSGRARPSRSSTCGRSWRPASAGCSRAPSRPRSARSTRPPGEQAILVLNRRGTASVVLCRDCGHVQACPDCERPLVYHQAGHDAALPSLRPGDAPGVALSGVRLAADPLSRRRHGAGRARGPRAFPGPARRPARSRRRRASRCRGAGRRRLRGGAARRPGRDQPRRQGPRHPVGDAGRDRVVRRGAQPARRARRRTDLPAPRPGHRPGRSRRAARAGPSSRPTSPTIRRSRRRRAATRTAFYDAELAMRERFGSPPFGRLVKLTVGLADPAAAEREARAMAERLRDRAAERGLGVAVVGPAPAYIARRADRWRWNIVPPRRRSGGAARRRRRRPVVGRRRPGVDCSDRDLRQMPGSPVRATMWATNDRGAEPMTEPRLDPRPRRAQPRPTRPSPGPTRVASDCRSRERRCRRRTGPRRLRARRAHDRDRDPRIASRGGRRPGRTGQPDSPRVLGPRGRAGRRRRGPGRAAGPSGRRGDLRREWQARHEVTHLGGGPPLVDLGRRRAAAGGEAPASTTPTPPPPVPDADDGPDRRPESGLISRAILRA